MTILRNEDTPVCEIYDNKFVIVSHGNPLDVMDEEDFFTGYSKPRNPLIMRIFHDLGYVERGGVGKYGREVFRFTKTAIRVTFEFDKSMEEAEKNISEKHPMKTRDKILEIITKKPESSMPEMAMLLGLSPETIRDQLARIRDSGKIRRVGPDKGGYWEIIE